MSGCLSGCSVRDITVGKPIEQSRSAHVVATRHETTATATCVSRSSSLRDSNHIQSGLRSQDGTRLSTLSRASMALESQTSSMLSVSYLVLLTCPLCVVRILPIACINSFSLSDAGSESTRSHLQAWTGWHHKGLCRYRL